MDPEIVALRKNFLEEFYKDNIKLIYSDISIRQNGIINLSIPEELLIFNSNIIFYEDDLNINTKEVFKLIKPLIYYLYSITYKKKFIRENLFLFTENIIIKYKFLVGNTDNKVNIDIKNNSLANMEEDNSFLKYYNEKELSENQAVNSLYYLKVGLKTYYDFENYENYITSIEELEENGELDSELIINRLNQGSVTFQESDDEEENIINSSQTFKTDECVICLTNPPHVLYCNCGHLSICKECDKIKTLSSCPVCKTENTILRLIE